MSNAVPFRSLTDALPSGLDGRALLLLLTGVFFINVLGLVVGRGHRVDA